MYNLGTLLGVQAKNPALQTSSANMYQRIGHARSRKYMHVIFRPIPPPLLLDASRKLRIPSALQQFLAEQNGAHLFDNAVCLFGIVPSEQHVLGRLRDRIPFCLEAENAKAGLTAQEDWIQIGTYPSNAALILVSRGEHRVKVTSATSTRVLSEWESLEQWLASELARFSCLYSLPTKKKARKPRGAKQKQSPVFADLA